MKEKDCIDAVHAGIKAIGSGDFDALKKTFTDDASFFIPQNPYRIDDLKTFSDANSAFIGTGAKIQNFDIRQPRVTPCGEDAAIITFHYSQRISLGDLSKGSNGRGTAAISGTDGNPRISHIHLTENATSGGVLIDQTVSAGSILASFERMGGTARDLLGGMAWGCE